jgi:hypothetical protein
VLLPLESVTVTVTWTRCASLRAYRQRRMISNDRRFYLPCSDLRLDDARKRARGVIARGERDREAAGRSAGANARDGWRRRIEMQSGNRQSSREQEIDLRRRRAVGERVRPHAAARGAGVDTGTAGDREAGTVAGALSREGHRSLAGDGEGALCVNIREADVDEKLVRGDRQARESRPLPARAGSCWTEQRRQADT